jgi:hypothetical protein
MRTTSTLRLIAAALFLGLVQSVVTATEPETAQVEDVKRAEKPPLAFAEWSTESSRKTFTIPATPAGEPKVEFHVALDPLWPNGYKTVNEVVARLAESGMRPATRDEFARFRLANPTLLERVFQDDRIKWGGYGAIVCLDLQGAPQAFNGNFKGRYLPTIYVDITDGHQKLVHVRLVEGAVDWALPSLEVHMDKVRTAILVTQNTPATLAIAPSPEP